MKNKLTIVLFAAVLCLSASASAQQVITFNGLPWTGAQLPIPSGYAGMNWNELYYTTLRFTNGLQNVAVPASGASAETMTAVNPSQPFHLAGLAAKGDYNTTLTLYGYNNGVFVGSQTFALAPVFTPMHISPEWGGITQVTFSCRDAQQKPAIFNLYSLTLQ